MCSINGHICCNNKTRVKITPYDRITMRPYLECRETKLILKEVNDQMGLFKESESLLCFN